MRHVLKLDSEIYIKNFPNDWDEETIKTEFGKCGTAGDPRCRLVARDGLR